MSIFNSDLKLEEITSLLKKINCSVHFVGVLGSGMYPLARLLLGRGYSVSGSDDNATADRYTDPYGILVQRSGHLPSCDMVVYSLAIDEANPEILSAYARGIPLISRAQLLGALMREYRTRISVSGSHGKSTTTALIDHIFARSGTPHTTVSGATLSDGEVYTDGGGEIFLAEACEYKNSFLRLCPSHQIITSIELDHTDFFHDTEMLLESFYKAAIGADVILVNADDPLAHDIALRVKKEGKRVCTYGKCDGADYRFAALEQGGDTTAFSVVSAHRTFTLSTSLIGEFNLYNITAAVAMADMIGIAPADIERGVASFKTIDRRLTIISEIGGTPIYYDYAHHPTEIEAVARALKERYGSLTVIFRPHTYSRTKSLWCDFIDVFSKVDFTILVDIYPAREKSIDGINSKALADEIPGGIYCPMQDAARTALLCRSGAVALMGAGEVDVIKRELIELGRKKG